MGVSDSKSADAGWPKILCPQETRGNAEKQWASVYKWMSVWERAKIETAIVIMLLRSRDYVVVMGTTFFPSRKIVILAQ